MESGWFTKIRSRLGKDGKNKRERALYKAQKTHSGSIYNVLTYVGTYNGEIVRQGVAIP